jgi:Na+-translocating ferredoxin:NAD+ oxidoreductase RnfC subunit
LIEQVRRAGVAGCGGAGFPTHVKLGAGGVDTLIVNAAECEPLLRTDRTLLLREAPRILEAVAAVRAQLGAKRAVIALKASYTKEIAALRQAIERLGAAVELHEMRSFYPAGDEQVMVYEVTGRVVPPAGIPPDVHCVVSNAATLFAVWQAMQGRPFIKKYLTVTGAVAQPTVLRVPLGTSFADCLAQAGGALEEDYIVVGGGPMMGKPMTRAESAAAFVGKTTSGYLVLPSRARLWQNHIKPERHTRSQARAACIQCSFCTQLCPRYLLGHPLEPHKIMRRMAGAAPVAEMLEDPVIRSAQYCCECGVCELIACPMQLQPRRVNVLIKRELAKQGLRAPKGEPGLLPRAFREERKLPTRRAALHSGAGAWYHTEIERFVSFLPREVHISLRGHIGAPAVPAVQPGDAVEAGQRIALCPEGKLGVDYHASIAGVVTGVGNCIQIQAESEPLLTV